jgi:hypothetical protein
MITEQATATYLMVAGLPVNATSLATTVEDVADQLAAPPPLGEIE